MSESDQLDNTLRAGPSKGSRTGWKVFLLVVMVLVAGVVTFFGCLAWAGYASLDAEKNMQATLFVIRLVDQFIQENRRWPVSWHDLATTMPENHDQAEQARLMFGDWPVSMEVIRQRIVIDFQPDLRLIAQQNVMAFDAIKPIGRHYPYRSYGWIEQLQKGIRTQIFETKDNKDK